MLASKGLQHQTLSALHYAQIARGLLNLFPGASFSHFECVLKVVRKTQYKEGRSQGEATPSNNTCHCRMLAVGLVTWHPYPEARPCDAAGGMLLRVLWVPEGGKIHSTLVREGFRCWSQPVSAGHCSG